MHWDKEVINVVCKLIGCSPVFVIFIDNTEFFYQMMIISCVQPLYFRIMSIDSYISMIIWDQECKNLLMKLLHTLNDSIQLDNIFYCNSHAVHILTICNIKCLIVTLDLTCKKEKVNLFCHCKIHSFVEFKVEPLELIIWKHSVLKLYKVLQLRLRVFKRNRLISSCICAFH